MMSPRPIRNKTSAIYGINQRTKATHLSFIFNDEGFATEDINSDALLERVFFLGLCCSLYLLIFTEFMIVIA